MCRIEIFGLLNLKMMLQIVTTETQVVTALNLPGMRIEMQIMELKAD